MTGSHPTSAQVRGIDARTTARWLLMGVGYLVMVGLGILGLVDGARGGLDPAAAFAAAFIALIGGAGLALSGYRLRAPCRRRGALLGRRRRAGSRS